MSLYRVYIIHNRKKTLAVALMMLWTHSAVKGNQVAISSALNLGQGNCKDTFFERNSRKDKLVLGHPASARV